MVRVAMAGLGKMGLSHHAIVNAHPGVKVVAACDKTAYLTDVLTKYTGLKCYEMQLPDRSAPLQALAIVMSQI